MIPVRADSTRLAFDRASGAIEGAGIREKALIMAFQAGARISSSWAHRGFGVGCRALRPTVPNRDMYVRLNEDAVFAFPFGDEYWSTILDRKYVYELDIDLFLRGISDTDYVLLDCGANYGYWSTLVSSRPYGSRRAIAIEPSSSNYAYLRRNAVVNGDRFETIKSAIGETSGTAYLSGRKHASMTIVDHGEGGDAVAMESLDDLMDRMDLSTKRLVLKLDVEGVEIGAMIGAARLLKTDCVVICEDHGSDPLHAVSKHVLNHTDMQLFCYDPDAGRYIHLKNTSPLDRIKKAVNRGYNVLATSSLFWEARILASST
ncbi:FkbM family methyltransferase [Bradyrhizobium sp. JYMT SZCCT0428]|uniref:FkbM family methyltransferase n=1 Tax=Bradyrhizobium sp. JYMT SZCCT0428 TaxID=2807673 RepID=UPI001BA4E4CC|nr:FkbM family methyltransferase [Bradyrhizobium sp. JYMT SZCCT0428]MBR1155791.1 FkbM family methyltransferase [Bradyrhizobium sp. JYMT SZCCT0428]